MIIITDIINNYIAAHTTFTTSEFSEMIHTEFPKIGRSTVYKTLNELCEDKKIIRIGRGNYAVTNAKASYIYELSDTAKKLAVATVDKFPLADFQIWELYQMNEFINFQLARNTIFIEVEAMLEESVFNMLFDMHSHVLLNPDIEEYYKYAGEETIVVGRLITEAPPCHGQYRQASLEKLLVDIFGHGLSGCLISRSEYPEIYEDAFEKYHINQSKMFRYARRRGIDQTILEFMRQETNIYVGNE